MNTHVERGLYKKVVAIKKTNLATVPWFLQNDLLRKIPLARRTNYDFSSIDTVTFKKIVNFRRGLATAFVAHDTAITTRICYHDAAQFLYPNSSADPFRPNYARYPLLKRIDTDCPQIVLQQGDVLLIPGFADSTLLLSTETEAKYKQFKFTDAAGVNAAVLALDGVDDHLKYALSAVNVSMARTPLEDVNWKDWELFGIQRESLKEECETYRCWRAQEAWHTLVSDLAPSPPSINQSELCTRTSLKVTFGLDVLDQHLYLSVSFQKDGKSFFCDEIEVNTVAASTLVLKGLIPNSTCTVRARFASTPWAHVFGPARLETASTPLAPVNVSVSEIDPFPVLVSWRPPNDDGGDCIEGYAIYKASVLMHVKPVGNNSAVVENLIPSSAISFRCCSF